MKIHNFIIRLLMLMTILSFYSHSFEQELTDNITLTAKLDSLSPIKLNGKLTINYELKNTTNKTLEFSVNARPPLLKVTLWNKRGDNLTAKLTIANLNNSDNRGRISLRQDNEIELLKFQPSESKFYSQTINLEDYNSIINKNETLTIMTSVYLFKSITSVVDYTVIKANTITIVVQ